MLHGPADQALIEISKQKIPADPELYDAVIKKMKASGMSLEGPECEKRAFVVAAELLLEKGASLDVQDPDNNNNTLLMNTIFSGSLELFLFFLSRHPRLDLKNAFGQTILHAACATGDFRVVEPLLQADETLSIHEQDENGMRPLHYAIHGSAIVRELLRRGAEINAKDQNGDTALHLAVSCTGPVETTQILLENGADFTIKNNEQSTALDIARARNPYKHYVALTEILTEKEFELNHKCCVLENEDLAALAPLKENVLYYDICLTRIEQTDYRTLAKKALNIQSEAKGFSK